MKHCVLALHMHYSFQSPHRTAYFCFDKRASIDADYTEAAKGSQDIFTSSTLKLPVVLNHSSLGALGKSGGAGMFPQAAPGRKVPGTPVPLCSS